MSYKNITNKVTGLTDCYHTGAGTPWISAGPCTHAIAAGNSGQSVGGSKLANSSQINPTLMSSMTGELASNATSIDDAQATLDAATKQLNADNLVLNTAINTTLPGLQQTATNLYTDPAWIGINNVLGNFDTWRNEFPGKQPSEYAGGWVAFSSRGTPTPNPNGPGGILMMKPGDGGLFGGTLTAYPTAAAARAGDTAWYDTTAQQHETLVNTTIPALQAQIGTISDAPGTNTYYGIVASDQAAVNAAQAAVNAAQQTQEQIQTQQANNQTQIITAQNAPALAAQQASSQNTTILIIGGIIVAIVGTVLLLRHHKTA